MDRYCVVLELGTGQGGLKDSLRIGSVCYEKLVVRTLIIHKTDEAICLPGNRQISFSLKYSLKRLCEARKLYCIACVFTG